MLRNTRRRCLPLPNDCADKSEPDPVSSLLRLVRNGLSGGCQLVLYLAVHLQLRERHERVYMRLYGWNVLWA